jgi:hypothetical protein
MRWDRQRPRDDDQVKWTAEEDETVIQCHAQWGNDWAKIAAALKGRSRYAVKNRWTRALMKRAAQMPPPVPIAEVKTEAVKELGVGQTETSDGEDTSFSEMQRFEMPGFEDLDPFQFWS